MQPLPFPQFPKKKIKNKKYKIKKHYEIMPIQIYWKFHQQKLKIFR